MKRKCELRAIVRMIVLSVEYEGEKLQTVINCEDLLEHMQAGTEVTFIENKYQFLEVKLRHGLVPRR